MSQHFWPLGQLNQIHIFTVHWYLPKEAVHQKKKKKLSDNIWEIKLLSEKLIFFAFKMYFSFKIVFSKKILMVCMVHIHEVF